MNNPINTTTTQTSQSIIAIDLSKDSLQIRTANTTLCLDNSKRGFAILERRISAIPAPLVVFEATGGYERPLADFLHERQISLSIVNPRLVRAFANSEGIKAKTDPLDAEMIYRFASSKVLRPTPAPLPEERQICDLLDRRLQIVEFQTREKNRIQKTSDKAVLASLRRTMKAFEKEIEAIEKLIRKLVAHVPKLRKTFKVISSVCGVGPVTAWTLLVQLPEITFLNRNELVALAGLAPFNRDSGKFKGKRHIYGGRAKIRRVLFLAIKSASQHNPVISTYMDGLLARGKAYKSAAIAACRKLLLHIQSLLKKSELSPC